jgi:hypothetical protein
MNNTTFPSADLFRELMKLAPPVTVEVNGETLLRGDSITDYRRVSKPNDALDALTAQQDVEMAKLTFEQTVVKKKLDFNKVQASDMLSTLDSLCDMLKAEITRKAATPPIFVCVRGYNRVVVFGSYEVDYSRKTLYGAESDNSDFNFSADILSGNIGGKVRTLSIEEAIIVLQSKYVPGDDIDYVVGLLSNISSNAEVKNIDNGLSQVVSASQGIAMKQNLDVKKRVTLRPFRTFIEVEQPASEYLLRLHKLGNDEVGVTLTPADGGKWVLEAKANIAAYLREKLSELIDEGTVIVMV